MHLALLVTTGFIRSIQQPANVCAGGVKKRPKVVTAVTAETAAAAAAAAAATVTTLTDTHADSPVRFGAIVSNGNAGCPVGVSMNRLPGERAAARRCQRTVRGINLPH